LAGEKEHSAVVVFVMFMLVLAIFGYGIWFIWGKYILNALKWICLSELYIIDIFVMNPIIGQIKEILLSSNIDSLTWSGTIEPSLLFVGNYMKYPFAIIFSYMAYIAYKENAREMLREKMGLEEMIEFQAKAWPYIKPFVNYDPGKESSRRTGGVVPRKLLCFAEALSPEEWLVFHDISIDKNSYEFDENKAKEAFEGQLVDRWRGTAKLKEHERALFAAFALKGARKRKDADEFLGELSSCWTREHGFRPTKKINKRITKILRDPNIGHESVKIANNHAYVNTAMLAVLDYARKRGGVLAPSQFVWLKGVDRVLWYALNSLGRRTYFSEGSGSISHYYIEKGINKALVTPNVNNAVESLHTYLEEHFPSIPEKEKLEEK